MKKLIVFNLIVFLLIPIAAIAEGLPNFTTSERILRIPQITTDDKFLYYDVELYLDFRNGILYVQKFSDIPPLNAIAELNLPFKLVMGQSILITGTDLSIQFSDVTEDSRCPSFVECGRTGEIIVVINTIRDGKSPEKITLIFPKDSSAPVIYSLPDYKLELLNVQPYPLVANSSINKEDYMVTVRIIPMENLFN